MSAYILRRFAGALPTLLIGVTITFFIINYAPGDPGDRYLSPTMSDELKERVTEKFGLNKPVYVRYLYWLKGAVIDLDFGRSLRSARPASEIIFSALKPTLLLTISALLFSVLVGTALGVYTALKQGGPADSGVTSVLLVLYSMPYFWVGMMLIILFAGHLGWVPAGQIMSFDHDKMPFFGRLWDYLTHLALPVLTLGIGMVATFAKFARESMIEALNSKYVLAARARGLARGKIIFTYGLRNALTPVISNIGVSIPVLFSGAVAVEYVFSLPGMGRMMVEAVLARDYPVIAAGSTVAFMSVILGSLLADILYMMADPRVDLTQQREGGKR